jgi:hypothetical protein
MSQISKYSERATVCNNRSCYTVYGEAAIIVNAIAITTVLIISFTLISKALK